MKEVAALDRLGIVSLTPHILRNAAGFRNRFVRNENQANVHSSKPEA
jgi:hypothetical protein